MSIRSRIRTAARLEKVHSNNFLLLIGVDKYEDNLFQDLNNPVRDVEEIGKILLDNYNFTSEAPFYTLLRNREATRSKIYERFTWLRKTIRRGIDNVLIFYSGHGIWDEETDLGFWIPSDAKSGDESSYIANATIINQFIRPLNTNHTVLISDSCCSGSIFDQRKRRNGFVALEKLYKRPSRWAFCSGRHDELVLDGPPGGHSPFAQGIIDFLNEKNASSFSISKMINEVTEAVGHQYQQLPAGSPLQDVNHAGGQFIFYGKNANDAQNVQISPPPIEPPEVKCKRRTIALAIISTIAAIFITLFLWDQIRRNYERKPRPPRPRGQLMQGNYWNESAHHSAVYLLPTSNSPVTSRA